MTNERDYETELNEDERYIEELHATVEGLRDKNANLRHELSSCKREKEDMRSEMKDALEDALRAERYCDGLANDIRDDYEAMRSGIERIIDMIKFRDNYISDDDIIFELSRELRAFGSKYE